MALPALTAEINFTSSPTASYSEILDKADGVVAFWRCNSSSTFLDSRNDNDGVIVGTPSTTSGAHVGDSDLALAFDGSADGAYIADSPINDKGSITLEGWMSVPSYPGAIRDVVSKRGAFWLSMGTDGRLTWTLKDDNSTASVTSTAPLATGHFYHIICFYTDAAIGIMINGQLDVSTAYAAGWESNSQPLRFALTAYSTGASLQSSQTSAGGGTTRTVTKPVSTADGDLLLAVVAWASGTITCTPPAGWIRKGTSRQRLQQHDHRLLQDRCF